MKNIFIFSGPTQTGKTSQLMDWAEKQENIAGILAPVIDGKRNLYNIKSKENKILEAGEFTEESKIINVGRFSFNRDVFNWGNDILRKALLEDNEWIVIDEVGHLELRGEGLEPAVTEIINSTSAKTKILIVVRKNLVNQFLDYYNLRLDQISIFSFNL